MEALGSAVANLIAVSNLLACSGVATIMKTKSKEKMIEYQLENGMRTERPTVHLKFDLVRSPLFEQSFNISASPYSNMATPYGAQVPVHQHQLHHAPMTHHRPTESTNQIQHGPRYMKPYKFAQPEDSAYYYNQQSH